MSVIENIGRAIKNPRKVPMNILYRMPAIANRMSDEAYLKFVYRTMLGKKLDLDNPQTFNEKLQWLKLHDRNPLYTQLVDKCLVKEWVAERIGEEHVVPTYAIWKDAESIDIFSLPDQFVLKTNHDSGGVVVCRDKAEFDLEAAKRKLAQHLKRNYYWVGREWPYRDVQPCVFAEKYLEDAALGELPDYKFFCFNGEVKALFVATERFSNSETKFDFFDAEYRHLPFRNGHPNADVEPSKPEAFEKMKQIAEELSAGMPHVRVDFYETRESFYFGEFTFSHFSGFIPFEPEEWDSRFGSWIELPSGGVAPSE